MGAKLTEYRPVDVVEDGTSNYVRVGDIVRVKLGRKHPFLAEVRSIDSKDGETPTDIEVIIRGTCKGTPHAYQGRVRYVLPEAVTRVAQTRWAKLRGAR